jgi:hypothetical protein
MKNHTCKIRGHKIVPVETEYIHIKEYECNRCKAQFTNDGYGRIVKLTGFWKQNNSLFESYFRKQTAI